MQNAFDPISDLYKFPRFQTQEAYAAATGQPCPAWNSGKPPKYWFDPSPASVGRGPDGSPLAVYQRVLTGEADPNVKPSGLLPNGAPETGPLYISVADAKAVNIPPSGPAGSNIPGADQPEVPVPLLPDSATQILAYSTMIGGPPCVRNVNVPLQAPTAAADPSMAQILTLVQAIGKFLQIPGF